MSRVSRFALVLALCGGCGANDPGVEGASEDPGSLCACREVEGVEQCCFGHGECVDQPEGPRRCECEPGARGETCSTPSPGVQPVRARSCEADDPGCVQAREHVVVEAFDSCVDLGGASFESVLVRPAADAEGAWPTREGGFPVALFVHGASQHAADYYDLLEHLAANDIVAAALDATLGEDVTFRANRLLSYLECLRAEWPDADQLSSRYAFVGHSRGGSAVPLAAEAVASGLAAPGVEVAAVVALAPTSKEQFAIEAGTMPAYLALSGARDSDTRGAALGWFDLAGEGDPSFVRGVVWIHGATHHRFHQGLLFSGTGESQASLSSEGHWAVARAYIGAFLQWRLLDRVDYRPIFTGAWVPGSIAAHYPDAPGVFAGLSEGSDARLVVHGFETDALSPSDLGTTVTATGFTDVSLGHLDELDPPWSSAHQGHGLRLDWDAGSPASLMVELPPDMADLGDYAVVSVRLARTFDAPSTCAEPSPVAGLSLRLHGPEGFTELALDDLGEAGRVEPPDRLVPDIFGAWISPDCHAQDFLRPLRIPLQSFCDAGLELGMIEAIELHIEGSHAGGLLVDSLMLERGEYEAQGCI